MREARTIKSFSESKTLKASTSPNPHDIRQNVKALHRGEIQNFKFKYLKKSAPKVEKLFYVQLFTPPIYRCSMSISFHAKRVILLYI